MSDNPYRAPGETLVLPANPTEVPSVIDKRSLLDSIKAANNGTSIDPVMHEQRYNLILKELIGSMDYIIQRTALGINDPYHFAVPYLRAELVDGDISCPPCKEEWKTLKQRLIDTFREKDWYLYVDFSIAFSQPWDIKFWRTDRHVVLRSLIDIKPL
jgi:hypothetical protein